VRTSLEKCLREDSRPRPRITVRESFALLDLLGRKIIVSSLTTPFLGTAAAKPPNNSVSCKCGGGGCVDPSKSVEKTRHLFARRFTPPPENYIALRFANRMLRLITYQKSLRCEFLQRGRARVPCDPSTCYYKIN
jgi:hypothetical protein